MQTRRTLDDGQCPCGAPLCVNLHLRAVCHPNAGLDVMYKKKTGALIIRCKKCNAFVVDVLVAEDLITL